MTVEIIDTLEIINIDKIKRVARLGSIFKIIVEAKFPASKLKPHACATRIIKMDPGLEATK
jgi:hypothetical protein